MVRIPIKHLSVRVPWHDNYWNGTVCKNPRDNGSCLVLKNIQPKKNVDFEEAIAGQPFIDLDNTELPPCVKERVMFMCPDKLVILTEHPYSKGNEAYSHYRETPIEIPAFSAPIVPFRWAMKDPENHHSDIADELGLAYNPEREPDLGFKTIWVQNHENQRELLDTFISAIEPNKSLILFYAKHIPLAESANRILIGAGIVKHFYDIKEYNYEPKIAGKQSYIWERIVEHSIRGNWQEGFDGGFILPYQELLELQANGTELDLELLVAKAPSWDEFSYGAEHVSHSTAIDSLHILATTLRGMEQPLGRSFEKEYEWIDDRISELWNMRGAFPGLGPVLTAFGIREGNFIAWEIAKKIEKENPDPAVVDTWALIEQMFREPEAVLPAHLAKKIGKVVCAAWHALDPDSKSYLKLMSRLEIDNKQADAFFDADYRENNGIEAHNTREFLENPYLLFEASINSRVSISLAKVDKAMLPAEKIRQALPVPEPSAINDPLDERRLRAVIIQVLEGASVEGHSLLPEYLLIEHANALALVPEIELKSHILQAIDNLLSSNIIVTEATPELPKFYQLKRLADIKKTIQNFVEKRHTKGQRLNVQANWSTLIDNKLGNIDRSLPEAARTVEMKARAEKVAALRELANARFSVMVGPAGTGKTTVLDILCNLPEIASKGVLKLAPTGKARVKLGAYAKTVAEFLYGHNRYDGETNRYLIKDGDNYSEDKTVIVDEASMLTEDQLAALIDCISGVERFILVGDFRQLPPIGTGRPFVDIVTYLKEGIDIQNWPIVGKGYAELSVICRQRTTIEPNCFERLDIRLARAFSGQTQHEDEDIFEILTEQSVWPELKLVKWDTPRELETKLHEELETELHIRPESRVKDFDRNLGGSNWNIESDLPVKSSFSLKSAEAIDNWQILSPVRGHGHGIIAINQAIQNVYRGALKRLAYDYRAKRIPKPRGSDCIVYGDKVINNRNTSWHSRLDKVYPDDDSCLKYIANGEIGVVIGKYRKQFESWHGELPTEVVFSSQSGYSYKFTSYYFKEESESPLELAYAITVHKSQGSGFRTVFLILPSPCILLSRELLYTALTRQEDRVIIFHQGELHDFKKYTSGEFSEIAKRLTNLFGPPSIKQLKNRYYDSKYINVSAAGEWMISKSEVAIANLLLAHKIKYSYETRLFHPDGTSRVPDFTIPDEDTGITYYWEHLGLLNQEDYKQKNLKKIEWYRSMNIIPLEEAATENNKILVTTRDKPDGGIDTQEIDNLIKRVFGKG